MKTRHEILMEDPEYRKLYAIEGLVTDAAELVARLKKRREAAAADSPAGLLQRNGIEPSTAGVLGFLRQLQSSDQSQRRQSVGDLRKPHQDLVKVV